MKSTRDIILDAAAAKGAVAAADTETKNRALLAMADALIEGADGILAANAADMDAARGSIGEVMLDRLALSHERIEGMANGIREVAALPDPVGRVLAHVERPNGLVIERTAVPMGVIAIIYESRPNVTADAAALAVKAGSACVLRAGREAHRSAAGLIRACVENATVPCIETGTGICHIYVDAAADLEMAVDIVENAKCSRPSVCNACEVCLVHKDAAEKFLPMLRERIGGRVELRLDGRAAGIIDGKRAGERDFDTEFLDYILAVGVVDSLDGAIAHIAEHSTGHSDCIITADSAAAARFLRDVDSAAVYVNASTRFTDGGEFGLGCEMGISTQKLHARGPMGLAELCTYKYIIRGDGQVR